MRNPRTFAAKLSERLIAYASNPRAGLYRLTAPLGNERLMRWVTAWPVTYADKLRYKMVRDRRPLVAEFADKVRAKEYVARVVGAEYAVDVLAVFEDAASIRVDGLPDEFVMKVTHGSAGMVMVRNDAPADARLPVPGRPFSRHTIRPEAFDLAHAREVFHAWLGVPYGARYGEWAYSVHPPRVVVEPVLRTREGGPIREVRIYVMNGVVVTFSVLEDRAAGRMSCRFLADGTWLPNVQARSFQDKFGPPPEKPFRLPETLPEMIEVAERVASETDFVRVDVHDLGDRFKIGELTNYPGASMAKTIPASFARWLGRQWTLPDSYDA